MNYSLIDPLIERELSISTVCFRPSCNQLIKGEVNIVHWILNKKVVIKYNYTIRNSETTTRKVEDVFTNLSLKSNIDWSWTQKLIYQSSIFRFYGFACCCCLRILLCDSRELGNSGSSFSENLDSPLLHLMVDKTIIELYYVRLHCASCLRLIYDPKQQGFIRSLIAMA